MYSEFRDHLTRLYTFYRMVEGEFHPADSFLTELILTHPIGARWLVRFIRTQPIYRQAALTSVTRLRGEVTRWWGPRVLAWGERQGRTISRLPVTLPNVN
jgi:hypothetical protein